ncbi:hypothetical protein FRC12_000135 [Ceratobasidium sp. 428]|nr:hypothetical protein FRC12_000135 [Ceratobasidium sp. 428]
MMPRTMRQEIMFRGVRSIKRFQCRRCGQLFAACAIENCADASRARRNRRQGRFIGVYQLCLFIERVRAMINYGSAAFVSISSLYEVIEFIAQRDNGEAVPVDNGSDLLRDVLNQLENLNIEQVFHEPDEEDGETTDDEMIV